ncbi:hypothetical protein [Sandaracinus amylolyticus]|uniref:hypothetical protein n=1 Tax=Sandaracinus amylolyticus TaxID=927083 RepID=UPI00069CC638|nr:hypothetical protein [Sandaracinus amylolyticus]
MMTLVLGCAGEGARATTEALPCGPSEGNAAMFEALSPSCAGCHGAGASRPFFASVVAFEDLLAYDERYVVAGDPEASALVAMLEGRGTGAYPQMPLAGDDFATLAARGETAIGMDAIRAWITSLPPPDPSRSGPDREAVATRRLSADEVINAIEVALGQAPSAGVPPLLRVDGMAPLSPDSPSGIDYNDGQRRQVYLMLGGPSYLQQRPPEGAWSPSSLLTLTQLAQGACSLAVERSEPLFFVHATRDARLPEAEPDVRRNLEHLYRRFLHTPPDAAEIDALFTQVYAPAEATSPRAAWTDVCTALIRDPLFVTF